MSDLILCWKQQSLRPQLIDFLSSPTCVADESPLNALFSTLLEVQKSGDAELFNHFCSALLSSASNRKCFSFHSKHVSTVARSLTTDARCTGALVKLLRLMLLSSPTLVSILPSDVAATAISRLLSIASQQHQHASAREEEEDTAEDDDDRAVFQTLQLLLGAPNSRNSFLLHGGAAIFSSRCLLIQRPRLLPSVLSVLHAATSDVDFCSESASLVQPIVALLNSNAGKKAVALHCLGIIQNLLREKNICASFWKNELNISTLLQAAVGAEESCDDEVRATAMTIIAANVSASSSQALFSGFESRRSSAKRDFMRCMTAALTLQQISASTAGIVASED